MTNIIHITEDEFDDAYPLLPNHLNPNAAWTIGDGHGCLFETYGPELEFVYSQNPKTVWTILDADADGDFILASGRHFINRFGYLISTVPVEDGLTIQCRITIDSDDE